MSCRDDSSSSIRWCRRSSGASSSNREMAASSRSNNGEPHQPTGRNGNEINAASCSAKPIVCTSSSQARSRQVAPSVSRTRSRTNSPPVTTGW